MVHQWPNHLVKVSLRQLGTSWAFLGEVRIDHVHQRQCGRRFLHGGFDLQLDSQKPRGVHCRVPTAECTAVCPLRSACPKKHPMAPHHLNCEDKSLIIEKETYLKRTKGSKPRPHSPSKLNPEITPVLALAWMSGCKTTKLEPLLVLPIFGRGISVPFLGAKEPNCRGSKICSTIGIASCAKPNQRCFLLRT